MHSEPTKIQNPTDYTPIRESQFAGALINAVDTQDKCSFNLILSMLTQDATELDQFHLPSTKPPELKSELNSQFNIIDKPIYGTVDSEADIKNAMAIHEGRKQDVVLDLCLKPQPLVKEKYDLSSEIFDNLDFNARQRLLNAAEIESKKETAISEKVTEKQIDVETWFNALHQSRVYANVSV